MNLFTPFCYARFTPFTGRWRKCSKTQTIRCEYTQSLLIYSYDGILLQTFENTTYSCPKIDVETRLRHFYGDSIIFAQKMEFNSYHSTHLIENRYTFVDFGTKFNIYSNEKAIYERTSQSHKNWMLGLSECFFFYFKRDIQMHNECKEKLLQYLYDFIKVKDLCMMIRDYLML